ncbi:MAG: DNA ligase [Candidatus Eisenbacteria bacterium]|nr:DNA ligase [Candidatus Eisenbacteria bacterium]
MPAKKPLEEYESKRDFHKTPEPKAAAPKRGGRPIFVVQKHDARNLHYDFRLEVDGVLKSWAVPKGPSTDPRVKRLAIPTEDHPLEYAYFEGVIPDGEYGGGTVLVWDTGPYRNLKKDDGKEVSMTESVDGGHLAVWLEGKKLTGGYALTRTGKGDDKRWLLVKMKDDEADARRNPVSTKPRSVLSGRTLDDIRKEAGSPS